MQGRDPDHEEEAAGQSPPPEAGHHPPEQPFYGGFAVPDNPYGEPETGDPGPDESSRPPTPEPRQPGPPDPPPTSGRGLFEPRKQSAEPPARSDSEKVTEAFRPASRDQEPTAPPPGRPADSAGSEARGNDGHSGPPTETRLSTQPPPRPPFGRRPADPPAAPPESGREGPPQPPSGQWPPAQPNPQGPPPPYGTPHGGQPQPRDPYAPPYHQSGPGTGSAPPARGGPGYYQPAPSYDFADIYAKPKRGKRGLFIAVVAVAVVLALGGGTFVYAAFLRDSSGPGQAPVAAPTTPKTSNAASPSAASPASSTPASPSFDPALIRNARKDSKPMRIPEAFPEKVVTVGGLAFERVATDMAGKCAKAGQRGFDRALRRAGCRRVLRATFVDKGTKYAATIGVAVLPTTAAARQVEKAAKAGKNVWFAALPGPKRSGAGKIHRSGGYSALEVVGHYVVFSFAVYADRIKPPPNSSDLSRLCARMRNYAAKPIVARGMTTPGQ